MHAFRVASDDQVFRRFALDRDHDVHELAELAFDPPIVDPESRWHSAPNVVSSSIVWTSHLAFFRPSPIAKTRGVAVMYNRVRAGNSALR